MRRAPLVAGLAISLADPGGPIETAKESMATLKNATNPPSREQLLSEVWGYDYFGGTRTVDVHVRRVRAKLGSEHASRITTVRSVGYRFDEDGKKVRVAARSGETING